MYYRYNKPGNLGDMINIAIALIAGIGAFNFYSFYPFTISAISCGTIIYLFFLCNDRKKVLFIFLVFITAICYSQLRTNEMPEVLLPSEEVHIVGTIRGVPEVRYEKLRIVIEDAYVESIRVPGIVRLTILQDIEIEMLNEAMLTPGDRISAFVKLMKPRSFRNPGGYSSGSEKNRVSAVGYVKRMKVLGKDKGLMTWVHKKRQRLAWIMENSLSEESAALHKAIVPGLKGGIGQEMRDGFSSTGLAHLLSISGTHFGLMGFIMFALIRGVVKQLSSSVLVRMTNIITPTQIAVLTTLPVLILYAFISGASLPTIRSLVMVIIYMMSLYLGRKGQWLNSLSIAALVILIWQPEALFELSFQLSFFAILSIGAVMEELIHYDKQQSDLNYAPVNHDKESFLKRVVKKIGTTLLITIAAIIGTAPFVVLYFNRFPIISPLTNLVITPLICFVVLPLGFFTGFIALLFNMSLMPLAALTDWFTIVSLRLVKTFSQVPYATISAHSPTIAEVIFYYSALLFAFRYKKNTKLKLLPLIIVLFIYLVHPYYANNNFSITFLDVGQGESTVVQLPDKEIMLIDGGVQKPDIGRMVIAPFLRSRGIKTIDYIVLSHAHPDHYGGLEFIVDNFNVREIWTNGSFSRGVKYLFQGSRNSKLTERVLRRGDVLEKDNFKVTVLHPYQPFYANSPRGDFSDENSSSLVLKIEAGNISVLFTGDIEEEAEEDLLYLGKWLKSDIIKVPHHGGKTSSSPAFIKAVSPKVAVVSAGRNNPFHHPHKTTRKRYEKAGVELFRTDMDGAITITSVDDSFQISTWQDGKIKKVSSMFDEVRNLKLLFSD